MVNAYSLMPVLAQQLRKVAASRLDKEVAAGNVSYSDVDPRIPRPMGSSGMAKRISRAEGMAPAARTPEQVNRTRTLNDALFKNQHARADRSIQGFVPRQPPQTERLVKGPQRRLELHDRMLPGMGPASMDIGGDAISVYAPHTSGQFIRTFNEPAGAVRAGLHVHPSITSETQNKFLVPPADVDRTLNHTIMQHEFGEADLLGAKNVTPFASHFGVQPITREQQALMGDPEAQAIMQKARASNPDDALVQRKLREAGATPNSPLPVEGRAARSVERNLAANPTQLNKATRAQTLQRELQQQLATTTPHPSGEAWDLRNYSTVPQNVKNYLGEHAPALKELPAQLQSATKSPTDKLRLLKDLYTRMRPGYGAVKNFLR